MLSVDANSTNGSSVPMTNSSPPADGGGNAIVKPPELEGLEKEGCLLWAKIRGYSYWPGVVTVDPLDGLTIKVSEAGSGTSGSKKVSSRRISYNSSNRCESTGSSLISNTLGISL